MASMDLESESSALEVSLISKVESIDDGKLVSASASVEAEIDEKTTTELDKRLHSPVETSPPIPKGFGLRKWKRRIRRDVVKDGSSVNIENSKVMKRVLSGVADPDAKQMHFSGT